MRVNDGPPPLSDPGERFIPGDAFERPRAFPAHPLERVQKAICGIDPLLVVVDLDAESPACERMIRVSPDADDLLIFHLYNHGACIGTIVRTCSKQ